MASEHALKIDAQPMNDLLSGAKTGEFRNDDRGFQVGDTVHLICADGRTTDRVISHIQRGYGLPSGICVLSYTRPAPAATDTGLVTVAWQRKHPTEGWMDCREEDIPHYRDHGQEVRELSPRSQAEELLAAEREEVRRLQRVETDLCTSIGQLEADNAAQAARIKDLGDYAREATKAITGLTGGGSENFGKEIGDVFTADLPYCVERIRERYVSKVEVKRLEAKLAAAEKALEEADEALQADAIASAHAAIRAVLGGKPS